jgi:hypothetical protein
MPVQLNYKYEKKKKKKKKKNPMHIMRLMNGRVLTPATSRHYFLPPLRSRHNIPPNF